jgi:hypothetical protein
VAGPRILLERRHRPDIVGQGCGDAFEDGETGRMDAVVVGEEDSHARSMDKKLCGGKQVR